MMQRTPKIIHTIIFFVGIFFIQNLPAYAEDYRGQIVRDIQIACVDAEEIVKLVRKQITLQPGDVFSPEKIRESIRAIHALKRFSQITVDAEPIAGGIRLSFCPMQIDTISKIQITGNKVIAHAELQQKLGANIGDRISPAAMRAMKERLTTLYRNHGYHHAQVNIRTEKEAGTDKVLLVGEIVEGNPSEFGKITFTGQTIFDETQLIENSKLHSGIKFSVETIEKGMTRIKQLYAQKGYLNVECAYRESGYHEETSTVDLAVTVTEGNPTIIRFEGNSHALSEKLRKVFDVFTAEGVGQEMLETNAEKVAEYYRQRGFAFVNVSFRQSEDAGKPIVTFIIDEGAQVRVHKISIAGNQTVKTKQIRKQMFTTPKGWFSSGFYQEKVLAEDLLAIKAFYQQRGYLEANIASVTKDFSPNQTEVVISLVIDEGVQTRIEAIEITGEQDEAIVKKLRKRLLCANDDPLNIAAVTQSIEAFKELYANQGYLKVNVDAATTFSDDKRLAMITLNIQRGQQFFIGKISIQGVIRTKPKFVTRELQVEEGDVYNPEKIRSTIRRLLGLGFYDSVAFRRLDPKSNNPVQDMILVVSEISPRDVEFRVGYSTENGAKVSAEYFDKNVLNYGGNGTAKAELSLERPKLTLQYLQPHFLTKNTSMIAAISDDLAFDNPSFEIEKRGGKLGLRHNLTDELSLSVGYYFEKNEPKKVKKDAVLSDLDTDNLNLGGFEANIVFDLRNDIIQPTNGGWTECSLRMAHTSLGAETAFVEFSGQSKWYLPLFGQYIFACALNGKMIKPMQSSDSVPIYQRYFLGGDSSVRGFKKYGIGPQSDQKNNIGGDRMLSMNVEFRFPIYSVLGGVIFYDAGASWLEKDGFDADNIRDAAGIGLRVATPVGPLRIDYGWKLDRRSGESAGNYYITIGSAF